MPSYINSYVTLAELKTVLGITTTTDDVLMRKIVESASRAIDSFTNRRFFITNETKYFDGAVTLWIPDLLTINANGFKGDTDGDGTYETTYATTDYLLYGAGAEGQHNQYPKIRIEINPNGDYSSFANGIKKGVQIAGEWGYGDGLSTTPYIPDTTLDGNLNANDTTFNVVSATNLSIGNTFLVELEQMYLISKTGNSLTVIRGVNGTSQVGHGTGKQVYIYYYPRDITQACMDLSVALYQNRARRGLASERIGDYSYTMGQNVMNGILREILSGYRKVCS